MELSVIIITRNSKEFLINCIESLYEKNKKFDFELIIIDNNSSDDTEGYIKTLFKNIIYYKNDINRGVSSARNQGLKIAKGRYKLVLDVDTLIITRDIFRNIINYMDKNENVAILGPKLVDINGELQYSCRKFPSVINKFFNRFIPNSKIHDEHYMINYDHNVINDVDYVIGAFQFLRSSALIKIGLYDENIFYGPEDIDLCLRAKKLKYKVIYYPDVIVSHYEQRITKKLFSKITFLHIKSLLYYFIKHRYLTYPNY